MIKWVHCDQHGAPHAVQADGTCWCGCIDDAPDFGRHATPLWSWGYLEAAAECRVRGLWLYGDRMYEELVSTNSSSGGGDG